MNRNGRRNDPRAGRGGDPEARAAALLRLGSSLAADRARDGFEARLRAGIEQAETSSPPVLTWSDGIGMVARPALGLASLALVTALVWGGWAYPRPSSTDDFSVLTGGDPAYEIVVAGGLDEIGAADAAEAESAGDPR